MNTTTNYKYTGLFVALVLPILFSFFHFSFFHNSPVLDSMVKETIVWLLLLMLFIIVKYGERESFAALGFQHNFFRSTGLSLLILISIYGAVIVYGILYFMITKARPPHEPLMDKISHFPAWFKVMLAVRAGVVEETFFRGYAISRLQQLTGNKIIAICVPVLIFAAAHLAYGTLNHFLSALVIGIVLTAYYVKTKNIVANIIAHFLFDIISLLLLHG